MIYRQLPVIEKSPIAPKYEIKSAAQHQTLRGRKDIYKNVLASYSGLNEHYIQVCITSIVLSFYGLTEERIEIMGGGLEPSRIVASLVY